MDTRDRHTRIVGWLKIALPLAALTLLSTLFLFARAVEPPQDLPFAQVELEKRAERQQVTRPTLTGATDRGDLIALTADEILPDPEDTGKLNASGIAARIDFVGGTAIRFRADNGLVDKAADLAALRGGVIVSASTGQSIRTEAVEIRLSSLEARATGPVEAEGPEGRLDAGGMTLIPARDGNDAQLVFMNGVKLVYDRHRIKDR